MHYKKWECVVAHTGRRSFATNMYKRNFPTLMIMRITGHKTEKAFLSYIKVTEEENAERMLELFLNGHGPQNPINPLIYKQLTTDLWTVGIMIQRRVGKTYINNNIFILMAGLSG